MALVDNLVAYYKLTNTADSVNGYTLANVNSVTFTLGKIGNGANFGTPNTDKLLHTTTNCGLAYNSSYSLSFWLNITTAPTTDALILTSMYFNGNPNGAWDRLLYYDDSGTKKVSFFSTRSADPGYDIQSYTFTVGTWYNLVHTYSTTAGSKVYINGNATPVLSTPEIGSVNQTDHPTDFCLGGVDWTDPGATNLPGKIDEVGVWSKVLTTTEIASLYNSGKAFQYPFETNPSGAMAFFH